MSLGDWNGGQWVQVRYLSTIIRWVTRSQFEWPLAGVLHQKCRILNPEFKPGPRLLFLRGNLWSGQEWLATPKVIWMLPWLSSECRPATEQERWTWWWNISLIWPLMAMADSLNRKNTPKIESSNTGQLSQLSNWTSLHYVLPDGQWSTMICPPAWSLPGGWSALILHPPASEALNYR